MMAKQETSHQQIFSYLIGGGDYYTSHQFQLLCYGDFDRFVCKETREREWILDMCSDLPRDGKEFEEDTKTMSQNEEEGEDVMEAETQNDDGHGNDEIRVCVQEGTVLQPDDVIDYCLRSELPGFDDLNLYEYVSRVKKILRTREERRLNNRSGIYDGDSIAG